MAALVAGSLSVPAAASASVLTGPVIHVPPLQSGPYLPLSVEPHFGEGLDAGRGHEGMDLFAPLGTPLLAVSPATVITAGSGYSGGEGNHVSLYDPSVNRTYNYFHLRDAPMVSKGQHVTAGQEVGELGCSGSCDGRHLHFEIRDGRGMYAPHYVDPSPYVHRWHLAPQPDTAALTRLLGHPPRAGTP